MFQEVGTDTWGLGNALAGFGGLAAMRGEPIEARRLIFEGFALWGEHANALIIAGHLRFLSMVANQLGQYERAARLAGASRPGAARPAARYPTPSSPTKDPAVAAARELPDDAFQQAWADGQAMSLEHALAYAAEET